MQVSDELYEHIRNACACIDDALTSETLADINDYLSMARHSAQSAFDMIEKQGEQKSKDKYTFNSIPRLLDMIEPTDRAKRYCQKLIDSLQQEGYAIDAKIISEHLKLMNGEEVSMATMDGKQGEQKRLDYPYATGWRENRPDNKPQIKHSVLMLTTHGVVEGEWLGDGWYQYRWTCKIKDTDVLYWLHLSDLESLEKEGNNIKPQNRWKPSEEQMQTLHSKLIEGSVIFPEDVRVLSSLYEDFTKLN